MPVFGWRRSFVLLKNVLMKNYISLLLVVLSGAFTLSAQTGSISGTLKTSDGQPAELINIGLKGTSKGAISNVTGAYEISNVEPGTYTLVTSFMGLETREQQVEVKAGETTIIPEIMLKENAQRLKEVIVAAYRSKNEEPVTIGKAPIRPLDLPQSVASIEKEVLEHQQVMTLGDALKNFNGVYLMGTTGGYQEEIAGRGFAFGSSNTFKNGIRFNNTAMPEMTALERIEVLKGSTAILFGNVAAGGVINLVTKKPRFENGGEVTMRLGSYNYFEPSVDVYGSLNRSKTAAFRINTVYENAESFRDVVKNERFYINPSFLVKLGKKTDLLLEGDYLNNKGTADFGVGVINYELIDIPRSRFVGVAWSYINTEQQSSTATITHRFNERWKLSSVTSYQNFKSDLFANQRPNGNSQYIQADGFWIRGLQRTEIEEDYMITQLDLTGKFNTGCLGHTLLLGADADKYNTENIAYNAINRYDTTNVFEPGKYKAHTEIPAMTARTLTTSPISRAGVYVQDLISVCEKIKVLAGIRFSYLETFGDVFTYSNSTMVSTRQFDEAFSPRFGIVYQPKKNLALFASFSNSFTPNAGVDVDGKALPPSVIDQYEGGFKSDLFKGMIAANVTVYQIRNSNLAQTSLANGNTNTNIKELAGEVTSKGLEVDLSSKEYKGMYFIAGYSYNDTRYTKSNTFVVGSKLRYNPEHTANASIYYNLAKTNVAFLNGFSAGFGALYIGDRVAGRSTRVTVPNDVYKLIPLPSYVNLEASLGYSRSSFSARVKVSNLLDALSYNVHDDNSVNPIAPRQVTATLSHKF